MPQLPVFKAFCPPLPLGEGGYLVLHEHIKLMKIDIGEQWGNDPALRSAAICRVPFPPLHISSLEHHLHQCDYPFVIYLPFQNRQHFLMVDIVKEAFDVELDNPSSFSELVSGWYGSFSPDGIRANFRRKSARRPVPAEF